MKMFNWIFKNPLLIFVAIIAPSTLLLVSGYFVTKSRLRQDIYRSHEELSILTTDRAEGRFDRYIDLGVAFATEEEVRKSISEQNWEQAGLLLKRAPQQFPLISQIAIIDPSGVQRETTGDVKTSTGLSFSSRDWYQGVTKEWKPYASNIYTRNAAPQYNIFSIAVPVFNHPDANVEDEYIETLPTSQSGEKVVGILVLQIPLEGFFEWTKAIEIGEHGFIYITDRAGTLANHPTLSTNTTLIDYGDVPAVQRALSGQEKAEILYNPVDKAERLVAYRQMDNTGWTVIVAQPVSDAFAGMNETLLNYLRNIIIYIAFTALLAAGIMNLVRALNKKNRQLLQSEAIILEEKARAEAILAGIGDGVFALDKKGNIVLFNATAEELSGYSYKEACGKKYDDILKFYLEKDDTPAHKFIDRALAGEKTFMENHTYIVHKSGEKIPVADSAAPFRDKHGKVAGIVVVFRDVAKEREIDRMKTEFISIASHQLKTPLTAMRWYSELLLGGFVGDVAKEQKEYAQNIYSANLRLIELVNALLNVSRIESGRINIDPKPTNIAELITSVIGDVKKKIDEKKQKLEVTIPEDLPEISIDPKMIRQVYLNFLTNANKYTPEGGTISIHVQKNEKELISSVSDTGYGIPQKDRARVFEKFYRGDNIVTLEGSEGTGLGLYLAKSIVETSGGKVWFESTEGKGSTFSFSIPLKGSLKHKGEVELS